MIVKKGREEKKTGWRWLETFTGRAMQPLKTSALTSWKFQLCGRPEPLLRGIDLFFPSPRISSFFLREWKHLPFRKRKGGREDDPFFFFFLPRLSLWLRFITHEKGRRVRATMDGRSLWLTPLHVGEREQNRTFKASEKNTSILHHPYVYYNGTHRQRHRQNFKFLSPLQKSLLPFPDIAILCLQCAKNATFEGFRFRSQDTATANTAARVWLQSGCDHDWRLASTPPPEATLNTPCVLKGTTTWKERGGGERRASSPSTNYYTSFQPSHVPPISLSMQTKEEFPQPRNSNTEHVSVSIRTHKHAPPLGQDPPSHVLRGVCVSLWGLLLCLQHTLQCTRQSPSSTHTRLFHVLCPILLPRLQCMQVRGHPGGETAHLPEGPYLVHITYTRGSL